MWLSPAESLGICRYAVLDTAECGIYPPMVPFYEFLFFDFNHYSNLLRGSEVIGTISIAYSLNAGACLKIRRGAVG